MGQSCKEPDDPNYACADGSVHDGPGGPYKCLAPRWPTTLWWTMISHICAKWDGRLIVPLPLSQNLPLPISNIFVKKLQKSTFHCFLIISIHFLVFIRLDPPSHFGLTPFSTSKLTSLSLNLLHMCDIRKVNSNFQMTHSCTIVSVVGGKVIFFLFLSL